MAIAGDKTDFTVLYPRQQAVPIELDLTDPTHTIGRLLDQFAELWSLIVGRGAADRARRRRPPLWLSRSERRLLKNRDADAWPGLIIMSLDEKPRFLLFCIPPVQPREGKAAIQ